MADVDTEQSESVESTERCVALTADGERCSRPAGDDGFCYQHDESDPTIDESNQTIEERDSSMSDSQSADGEQRAENEGEVAPEGTTDPEDVDTSEVDLEDIDIDESKIEGVLAVRQTVQSTAGALIGRPFDGVSEVTPLEEGWEATVEVVERRAVPDTQDILGRYEIELDDEGVVQGYRRLDRYRRGDTLALVE